MLRLFILCLLVAGCGRIFAGGVDRLIVAVNGKVITEGDIVLARSVNTILFPDQGANPKSEQDEIDHLVDLELMRQELQNFSISQEDESRVQSRLQSLRDEYAGKGGLSLILKSSGLQESELIAYLRLESSIMRFVEFRFRPFAGISQDEIKNYYESRLSPQLRTAKLELPPIEQVSSRIEEILREEKINAVMEQWIKGIRRVSRIEYFNSAQEFDVPDSGSAKP